MSTLTSTLSAGTRVTRLDGVHASSGVSGSGISGLSAEDLMGWSKLQELMLHKTAAGATGGDSVVAGVDTGVKAAAGGEGPGGGGGSDEGVVEVSEADVAAWRRETGS